MAKRVRFEKATQLSDYWQVFTEGGLVGCIRTAGEARMFYLFFTDDPPPTNEYELLEIADFLAGLNQWQEG